MTRKVLRTIGWIGRVTSSVLGLVIVVTFVIGVASAALGANGNPFILGKNNVATLLTKLGGRQGVNGAMLEVQNNDDGTDDTALSLKVQAGEAPMTVNSSTKVVGLNADDVDGLSSSAFMSSSIYKTEATTDTGTLLGDGTEVKSMSCDAGDVVLAGGPASVNAGSTLLDSFATDTRTWQARIAPVAGGDNFTVVILCANNT